MKKLLSGLYVDDGREVHRLLRLGERYVEEDNMFKVIADKEIEDIENSVTRAEITRREVQKAMNTVNDDLKFTMELCTDFPLNRLPTLSFSLWTDIHGIKHTYFEKAMKNQTLLLERTSMSRQSLYSILSNELRRRLETLDDELGPAQTVGVIDKYIQQLVNSEFGWSQIHEIIVSALL